MDPLSITGSVITLASTVITVLKFYTATTSLVQRGGPAALLYVLFGSRTTWRSEAHVLGTVNDQIALDFKKSVQDECSMVSVAAAIVAQISISAYSLDSMDQTHWVARGFFIFGLVTSLMSVYYATTLHRIMGRQLEPAYVRAWIRGFRNEEERRRFGDRTDPQDFHGHGAQDMIDCCFRPAYATVLTLSAPQVLLSTSLFALLIGIGVYLGFMWTNHVDDGYGKHDSRNIWIVYLITAVISVLVYSTSRLITESERLYEEDILLEYCRKWVQNMRDRLGEEAAMPRADVDADASKRADVNARSRMAAATSRSAGESTGAQV